MTAYVDEPPPVKDGTARRWTGIRRAHILLLHN